MLKVISITEGRMLEERGGAKKHTPDLTWVGLSRHSAFSTTGAASIKSSGLCIYRGVSRESSRKPDVN